MKTLEQAIEEQIKTIADNYAKGKIEFGLISMNLIRSDCGISPASETKEERQKLISIIKKITKRYGLKYSKGKAIKNSKGGN